MVPRQHTVCGSGLHHPLRGSTIRLRVSRERVLETRKRVSDIRLRDRPSANGMLTGYHKVQP